MYNWQWVPTQCYISGSDTGVHDITSNVLLLSIKLELSGLYTNPNSSSRLSFREIEEADSFFISVGASTSNTTYRHAYSCVPSMSRNDHTQSRKYYQTASISPYSSSLFSKIITVKNLKKITGNITHCKQQF